MKELCFFWTKLRRKHLHCNRRLSTNHNRSAHYAKLQKIHVQLAQSDAKKTNNARHVEGQEQKVSKDGDDIQPIGRPVPSEVWTNPLFG